MNRRMVLNTLGHIALANGGLMLLPAIVSLIYAESCIWSFLIAIGVSIVLGLIMMMFSKPGTRVIYTKEGFAIASYGWLLMALIGALPFVLSGEIPSYIDAFFETVSGLTTTGASILTEVEGMSKGILFWRSFTHWIGGMGVLVLVMAIIPNISDRSIHLMRAEMPGPEVGKLRPKARDTAKILYLIYIGLTVVETVFLLAGGMSLFESIVHTFGTAGTGGFSIKNDSIAGYSPYLQWVIACFMLVFSINFNLYYLLLVRKIKAIVRSTELWFFAGIVVLSITVISLNIYNMYSGFEETLRTATFQVATIVSTTGYATADFNLWPGLSKTLLLLLMIIGGCAGSTAGGLKASRVILLVKSVFREFKKSLHPRSVNVVKMDSKRVDEQIVSGVGTYFAVYCLCTVVVFALLSIEPFDIETNLSATVACFNNIGPGLGGVGPTSNYSAYSGFSKIILSLAMLLGRLEVFPLILGLNPLIWKKR